MTPEQTIKTQICQWLELHRIFFWIQVQNPGKYRSRHIKRGICDLMGIFRGKPLAIEVKAPGGRVSPEQEKFIEEFRREGGIAFTAKSVEEVEKQLKEVC
jgi:hypothetical protein